MIHSAKSPKINRDHINIERALLSVSDKTGLIPLASALHQSGVELVSTGGTRKVIAEAGIPVTDVSEITQFRECLDGRVKTLHPAVHAGILARNNHPQDIQTLQELGIRPFNLVVVNLYPFREAIAKPEISTDEAIEYIDIGGPAMVRASAKNYGSICILTSPDQYALFLNEFKTGNSISYNTRKVLSASAFSHTAAYDCAISDWMNKEAGTEMPAHFSISLEKSQDVRYGENPQQHAAVYGNQTDFIDCFHGKELSYNNFLDVDAALNIISDFDPARPACAIIKHTNPSGIACADTLAQAYKKAFQTDTVSPFGGIIVFNRELDVEAAAEVDSIFSEIIIAPEFFEAALELLTKKINRRLIRYKKLPDGKNLSVRAVVGGLLVQQADTALATHDSLQLVTKRKPTSDEISDMMFAWKVVKHVKSNAIVFAKQEQTLGIGVGQTSRVDATEFAISKAAKFHLDLKGSVLASDAFFPFSDGVEAAAKAGVTAVIQPGGSIRDTEIIAAADKAGLAMVFTNIRHFKH